MVLLNYGDYYLSAIISLNVFHQHSLQQQSNIGSQGWSPPSEWSPSKGMVLQKYCHYYLSAIISQSVFTNIHFRKRLIFSIKAGAHPQSGVPLRVWYYKNKGIITSTPIISQSVFHQHSLQQQSNIGSQGWSLPFGWCPSMSRLFVLSANIRLGWK